MNDKTYPGIKRTPTANDIADAVSEVTGVTFDQARARCRKREVVFFRYVFWYFMRKYHKSKLKDLSCHVFKSQGDVVHGLNACKNISDNKLQDIIKKVQKKLLIKVE
jgi:chromosomal replication initiation ATPase DnaA